MAIRAEVAVRGRVQGVGFRVTTFETAKSFEVTGFVRNEKMDRFASLPRESERKFKLSWNESKRECMGTSMHSMSIGMTQPAGGPRFRSSDEVTRRDGPGNVRRRGPPCNRYRLR